MKRFQIFLSVLATLGAVVLAALAPPAEAHEGKLTFAPILEDVTPAVVSIRTRGPRGRNHLFNDPFFRYFFDRRELDRREPQAQAAGSGVIVDAANGHVVTNHHVVANAEEIVIELKDRRTFEAELIGSDPETDMALLKIDADDLEALPLGDSDELAVGDFVVAIGNPFALGQTVTSGIVSALGRVGGFSRNGYEDFIQTDAAINRGNSGGALVDLEGHLVGINTAIITPTGANAGIGFAVPANIVRVVTGQLLEYGGVRRGFLGVAMTVVTPEVAEALGLDRAEGVIVSEVVPDSAAEEAGIEPGDVIASIDGEDVLGPMSLRTRIGLAEVGDEIEIGIIRDGENETLSASIGAMEGQDVAAADGLLDGATLRDIQGRRGGVEVVDVEPNSRAAASGLRIGDEILAVNRRSIENVQELNAAIDGHEQAGLHLRRGDRRLFAWVD